MARTRELLKKALQALNPADSAHWTKKGLPDLTVVDEYMREAGYDKDRLRRGDMPSSFTRAKAVVPEEAPAEPESAPEAEVVPDTEEAETVEKPEKVFLCYRPAQRVPVHHEMDDRVYTFYGEFRPTRVSPEIAEKFIAVDSVAFVLTDELGQQL